MSGVLVDSNVLLDIALEDSLWFDWSAARLTEVEDEGAAVIINPIIYAELSAGYPAADPLDALLADMAIVREDLPWSAAFAAGRAFVAYRRRGGVRTSPLPDFFIGAHALVAGHRLLTRDGARYRTYFPELELIAP
ncbi:type II toxin-antitoxin system VapC family toxin [Brevundimonas sp. SL130]|uniref:type II toxin-antitoxin system VapC family toxin n=1 Tax=Brevundimonas sp. SL130 TaxID=2995143 RepID=UPI00226C9C94|nr:type II toxin-antitoxin system VapC family toxin [Brevundimonas sp. SL130]WAC61041.1 type II toxin-antitoxin system VapC family toxin [Brevundimonas sp. SL130]